MRVEEGAVTVREIDLPADGEENLVLHFGATDSGTIGAAVSGAGVFVAGTSFAFSIDVDDRLEASELGQTRISGEEIEGGRLSVELVHTAGITEMLAGYFGADARVELIGTPCPEEDGA